MEKDWDRIDRLFRERLAGFEEKPDDQLWEKIAGRLGPAGQRRKLYLFIRIAAGMTLLFSLGLGYYLINRQSGQEASSIISYKGSEKNDTIREERPRKSTSNIPEKKKGKSDRLRPVRKVYKGPEISLLDEGLQKANRVSVNHGLNISEELQDQAGRETIQLALLRGNHPGLSNAFLPQALDYSRTASAEPDYANLLSDLENMDDGNLAKEKKNRWLVGGEIAPLYSYRTIASDNLASNIRNTMNESENGLMAYAGGVRLGYAAGKRLSIQTGLYYSRYGQEKTNVKEYTTQSDAYHTEKTTFLSIANSTGEINTGKDNNDSKDQHLFNSAYNRNGALFESVVALNEFDLVPVEGNDLSATQYFDYLELPVTIKYKIINRKLGFSFIGGMVTNFLVNNGVRLTNNGNSQKIATTDEINSVNYLGSVGIGFDYPLLKKVAFSLEPRFRYYINSIDKNNVHPYSFGIFAGFSYGL